MKEKGSQHWKMGLIPFLLLALACIVISPMTGASNGAKKYTTTDKEYYVDKDMLEYIRPGLNVDVQKVDIEGQTVKATIRVTDDKGVALDRMGIQTPGVIEMSFILARIPAGERQYTAYTTRMKANEDTGELFLQAATDEGGTFETVGDGVYTYTFGTRLPADFDPSVTHTVGVIGSRDLSEFGLNNYVANAAFDFVPDGSEVTVIRDVVRTENCDRCHDPLEAHEGSRTEVRVCVLCHTPQTTDAVTEKTVDMKVMIHKIHRGSSLPSVEAGGSFIVEDEDFSEVKFPQDIRNCTVCHQKGTQSDNYLLKPSRAACGSCHDDVNFSTGEGHGPGGVQTSDDQCTVCHAPETGREFDISIKGAHTIPWKSKQLAGLHVKIQSVTGATAGSKPTVVYSLTDDDGTVVDPTTLGRFRLGLGGPTNDSVFGIREDARQATPVSGGFSYQFQTAIPADAKGTWMIGTEGFRDVDLTKVDGGTVQAREAPFNELYFIPLTDSKAVRRRPIVATDKCNVCHERLALHGTSRQNVEYCSMCHRAAFTDEAGRPADKMPAETLDFKNLIHKIHSGHHLTAEFTIYDEGNPENFNELHFPGDRRDCAKCHVGTSYQVPIPAWLSATTTPRGFFSPTPPTATACLACHDTVFAAAHAFTNTAPFGEGCAACHGEGREFAVSRVHAR